MFDRLSLFASGDPPPANAKRADGAPDALPDRFRYAVELRDPALMSGA